MTVRRKLVAFAVVLLAVFGAGYGLGAVADPGGAPAPMDHTNTHMR